MAANNQERLWTSSIIIAVQFLLCTSAISVILKVTSEEDFRNWYLFSAIIYFIGTIAGFLLVLGVIRNSTKILFSSLIVHGIDIIIWALEWILLITKIMKEPHFELSASFYGFNVACAIMTIVLIYCWICIYRFYRKFNSGAFSYCPVDEETNQTKEQINIMINANYLC